MKKNEKISNGTVEGSTVLSDPKKAGRNGRRISKRKIVLWTLAVLLVVFVAIPWGIVQIAKMAKSTPKPTFNERLSKTVAYDNAKMYYTLKTPDGNDQAAVGKILDTMEVAAHCGEYTLSVSKSDGGVDIVISLAKSHDPSRDEWFKMQMIKYSCAMFGLVDNLQKVTWQYPNNGSGNTGGYFTRGDAELFLGYPASLYGQSEKGVQLLLNDLGLDE